MGDSHDHSATPFCRHIDFGMGDQASVVFRAAVWAEGFSVLVQRRLGSCDRELKPDSIEGERVFWFEDEDERRLVVRYRDNEAIVLVSQEGGCVEVAVAANNHQRAHEIVSEITDAFPSCAPGDDPTLPITFWHLGGEGRSAITRKVEVVRWQDVAANYAAATRLGLASLMEGFTPDASRGRIMLWHGEPGTGKTYAVRALAWAWREWCRFEYVIDPDRLFDCADYLMQVLLHSGSGEGTKEKWRLLILEDSGEMVEVDAKRNLGQGLSRLLNVSDGILGQGTRLMILLTSNEDPGKLNPAIVRPGRCLSEIEFRRLSTHAGNLWLHRGRCDRQIESPRTLSELYAELDGRMVKGTSGTMGFRGEPIIASE